MLDDLDTALSRSRKALLKAQSSRGSWSWPVISDPRTTAMYLTTMRALNRPFGPVEKDMEVYLANMQAADGTWESWPNSTDRRKITAICALALERSETPLGRAACAKANFWLANQDVPHLDGFWLGYFALNGDIDWSSIPFVSTRILSIPKWIHPNISDFGVMRLALVSTSIIQCAHLRSGSPATSHEDAPEWKRTWLRAAHRETKRVLPRLTQLVRRLDRCMHPSRALSRALDWLEERREADGSFFSSAQMTSIAVYAFHATDPDKYKTIIDEGLESLRKWQFKSEHGTWQAFTDSTIWDTAITGNLLVQLQRTEDEPAIQHARDYLWSRQIMQASDTTNRTKWPQVGGWAFQDVGRHSPDVDDTVVTLRFLLTDRTLSKAQVQAAREGILWVLAMQGRDGGWASWDRNDRGWQRILQGGEWFLQDLPCPAITARAAIFLKSIADQPLDGLSDLSAQCAAASKRGFEFCARGKHEGKWLCHWFTHYIYGTCYGIRTALADGGDQPPDVRPALNWFSQIAQPDGGFGESPESLIQGRYVQEASSVFHTACVLRAFVAAGAYKDPVAQRAAQWLLKAQHPNGDWKDPDAFGAGIPGVWYVNFSGTPTIYAAMALLELRKALVSSGEGL